MLRSYTELAFLIRPGRKGLIGIYVNSSYGIYDVYYGAEAWYISVLNENTGAVKSAYVIGDDCYFVEDGEEETEETEETNINVNNREYWAQEYADTTLVDAVDLAASCIDDGWGYTYSEQTRYNGFAAWAIVFTNSEGEDVVVFVNGTDCYLN